MTREDLARLLETFAVLVLKTSATDLDPDSQYAVICSGIDNITDTVMFCTDRSRIATPSVN